ncbi:MAG: glycine zipper family protein, partial [Myxococcota bacterium]
QAKDAAVNTLGGAAGGAALGAITGAILGNAGAGAAAGAALGGTVGLGKTVYDAGKPTQAYKGYVNICLENKGYQIVDWQ